MKGHAILKLFAVIGEVVAYAFTNAPLISSVILLVFVVIAFFLSWEIYQAYRL